MNLATLLFSFQGRINRAKFWLAILIYFIAFLVIFLLFGAVAAAVNYELSMTTLVILAAIVYIPILISGIAVGIKRLHDRNKSGWWLLLFYLVPNVLQGIGGASGGQGIGMIFALIGFAISIWALVELGILRGASGPNQYGPDPLPASKYDE